MNIICQIKFYFFIIAQLLHNQTPPPQQQTNAAAVAAAAAAGAPPRNIHNNIHNVQTHEMNIPNDLIGCIIGRGGQKISEIRYF